MPKATMENGDLISLNDAYIFIPGYGKIRFHSLPDISDSKSASYNDEPIIGRTAPIKAYSHSESRSINITLHLFSRTKVNIYTNLNILRAIQSCVYPREDKTGNAPYIPPVVCQIKCGELLGSNPMCVVMKSYSVKYPVDVPWDEDTYIPWKFDIDTTWEVVNKTSELPGQERILDFGG